MIFFLESDLFNNRNKRLLTSLLSNSINNLAFLHYDQDNEQVMSWLNDNYNNDWDTVYNCWLSDASRYRQTNTAIVKNNIDQSDWEKDTPEITIQDAYNLSLMPYEIWVENARNDGAFIKCVLGDNDRTNLINSINIARLKFNGLGGICELRAMLLENINQLGYRNKMIVVCDSDAPKDGDFQKNALDIITLCNRNKIAHHCLRRRAIENYIPINFLIDKIPEEIRDEDDDAIKYQAFLDLNEEQQYHFHMKKGFRNATCKNSGLYDNIDSGRFDLFKDGFGNQFANVFTCDGEERDIIHSKMHENDRHLELTSIGRMISDYTRVPV